MLFTVIQNHLELSQIPSTVEACELRLDLFPIIDFIELERFLLLSSIPVLFTVRKASEGGNFTGSIQELESLIQKLLSLHPPFMDLEWDMPPSFLHTTLRNHPDTTFILSYHNFNTTPSDVDLHDLYTLMSSYPAHIYKIATLTSTTTEALRLLHFGKKYDKVSVIPMGEQGSFARVLLPTQGMPLGYTVLSSPTASGQLSLQELLSTYSYSSLDTKTKLYGLIGDPVTQSIGHLYHNDLFHKEHSNSVYVKMKVKKEELSDFFSLAKEIGFSGLSVTMPLKELVFPFLDILDPSIKKIGAVNTIRFQEGKVYGTNTDGIGALDALEMIAPVRGKTIVILGCGGAAKAVAFEAVHRGADVWISNRTYSKAVVMAEQFGCKSCPLSELPQNYDILLNCTPSDQPIDPNLLSPFCLIMDLAYYRENTPFLEEAKRKNCHILSGKEMFFLQAQAQRTFWKLHSP